MKLLIRPESAASGLEMTSWSAIVESKPESLDDVISTNWFSEGFERIISTDSNPQLIVDNSISRYFQLTHQPSIIDSS